MKKILFLLVALFIGLNLSFASNDENPESPAPTVNMTGKIIDKITGETLAGVMVKLDGTDKYVFSDFDGNFTFENLKKLEYKVIFSLISYEENISNVDLNKAPEEGVNVKLETVN